MTRRYLSGAERKAMQRNRLAFVLRHRDLWSDKPKLVKRMKAAGLYAETTYELDIERSLDSYIAWAKVGDAARHLFNFEMQKKARLANE